MHNVKYFLLKFPSRSKGQHYTLLTKTEVRKMGLTLVHKESLPKGSKRIGKVLLNKDYCMFITLPFSINFSDTHVLIQVKSALKSILSDLVVGSDRLALPVF